ncbi:MAG: SPOR domain-containing protein [Giesbergeria sp.]|uniref:SPOR domain-containing protein n=1 Tax=Giesbergeria sp. TaxID=2818473 RepID=UPI00262915F6|nr:SPOR domain-containing protein [Giesbergeria sp.]MDD2609957.1 SPOR domain-containing protein [Giesbergeria sp.]
MLRSTVLILALANAGYYAWSHGLLPLGNTTTATESEPQRVAQQLHPEALRIVPKAGALAASTEEEAVEPDPALEAPPATIEPQLPTITPPTEPATAPVAASAAPATPPAPLPALAAAVPAAAAVTAAAAAAAPVAKKEVKQEVKPAAPPTICLQAGAFNTAQAEVLRKALGGLPAGSWNLSSATLPGRWMVYMGRFPDLESLNKKRKELQERNISYDRPRIAALEPGLSLGRYSSEEAGERALAQLNAKGIRSAKVVQERAETPAFVLRLPTVAPDARQRIASTLRPALAGKTLRPCAGD